MKPLVMKFVYNLVLLPQVQILSSLSYSYLHTTVHNINIKLA
jgi:hypothetical protein